jgi:heme-degrading monooxygenase HmoA
MHVFLKGAAIALALAGATFATAGTASAAGISFGISDNGRHHASSGISFSFGDVAIGYRDGYWDNGHRWHNWRNNRDRDGYRRDHGDNYRNGYHHRYRDQGWRSDRGRDNANSGFSFNFGDVAFAYRDGYWDNSHRWHKWRNSREHREYRNQHGDNYRNGYHHRYRGQGWRRD